MNLVGYLSLVGAFVLVLFLPWVLRGSRYRDRVVRTLFPLVAGVSGATLAHFFLLAVPLAFAQTSPHLSDLWIARRLMIGPVNDTSNSNRMIEVLVKDTDEPVEVHTEGGGTTGYVGFGCRNDRGVDGSNNTLAGGALVAYGSAYATSFGGRSLADMAVVSAAGTSSRGLAIITQNAGPIFLATKSAATSDEPRMLFNETYKALTNNTVTAFARIDIATSTISGGIVPYSVWAVNGSTDLQSRSGILYYSIINKSGTETCAVGNSDVIAASTGTLTATFSCDTTPTNGINLSVNANSSLSVTAVGISYSVVKNAGQGAINPL